MLSEREQAIRKGRRREKRERWAHIRDLILSHHEHVWLDFWREHWPPDKHDMGYAFGKDNPHLRRHVRIELYYLRQSIDYQERYEGTLFAT